MAKRPSVQEILQAARRGGSTPSPVAEAAESPSDQPAPTPVSQAPVHPGAPRPRLSLQEKLAKAQAEREARAAGSPPSPGRLTLQEKLAKAQAEREARAAGSPASPGRLSLQEKLAKAQAEREARASGSTAAAPKAKAPVEPAPGGTPPRLTLQEKLAAARGKQTAAPSAPAPPPAAPAAESSGPGRLSLQEKLAAARSGKSAPPPTPEKPASKAAGDAPARPLSMQEKLAAARSGGSARPTPAPSSASPVPPIAGNGGKAMSVKEKLAAARGQSPVAPAPPAPPVPPTGAASPAKAMSVKDKLAAARGQSPSTAEATPAQTPPPPAAARTAPADRVLPPLAEMTDPKDLAEALRRTGARKAAEAAAAPAVAKAPGRPATFVPPDPAARAAVPEAPLERPTRSQVRLDRRGLLVYASWWVVVAWVALAATIGLLSMMVLRFLFPNASPEPPSTVKVGFPSDYEPGEVSERFKDRWGFWVVRDRDPKGQEVLYALQAYCTHLGCPPSWLPGERKFKCPCHGSGFSKDGVNFEGPAPRPLERYKIGLADDGSIVVDKSQTFRKDLDQWSDPDSFLAV